MQGELLGDSFNDSGKIVLTLTGEVVVEAVISRWILGIFEDEDHSVLGWRLGIRERGKYRITSWFRDRATERWSWYQPRVVLGGKCGILFWT